jgi:hypothetical protein
MIKISSLLKALRGISVPRTEDKSHRKLQLFGSQRL